ncbi:MAG: glycosyltransferase family 4 protein, partial [Firmicutes bacterium]|nr:glycosyltransferase family 4 protein [Bacillota bacterium]
FLFSKAYSVADTVLCHTEYEKELLSKHYNIRQSIIKIIPSGVDIEGIKNAKPYNIEGNLLCIVSRLEKYKNIHIAIEVLKYLPENYRLIIIGDGAYRKNLENYVNEHKLNRKVSFLGCLSNEDVYRWYKTCNVVLNFSSLEAFGLTVIESLASGKPVIVNNNTALAELAKRFKYVYSIDINALNYTDLANLITKATATKTSKLEVSLNKYTWELITQDLVDLYKNVINGASNESS